MVKVGAFNVGRIPVEYEIPDSRSGLATIQSAREFTKGEEIARFELGSTVILLFEKDRVDFEDLKENQEIKMGEKIGVIKDF
jgi:phosphatidylserine decarboxylase